MRATFPSIWNVWCDCGLVKADNKTTVQPLVVDLHRKSKNEQTVSILQPSSNCLKLLTQIACHAIFTYVSNIYLESSTVGYLDCVTIW